MVELFVLRAASAEARTEEVVGDAGVCAGTPPLAVAYGMSEVLVGCVAHVLPRSPATESHIEDWFQRPVETEADESQNGSRYEESQGSTDAGAGFGVKDGAADDVRRPADNSDQRTQPTLRTEIRCVFEGGVGPGEESRNRVASRFGACMSDEREVRAQRSPPSYE